MSTFQLKVLPGFRGSGYRGYYFAAVALGLALAGCGPKSEAPKEAEGHAESGHEEGHDEGHPDGLITFDAKSEALAGIKITEARLASLPSTIAVNGQITANPDGIVRVTALVPGRVIHLNVAQGARVSQGQVLAVIESRSVGEAQSAYRQAAARLKTAKSNLDVVLRQANAGVFANAPLEAARKAQADAKADVAAQTTAFNQARITLDNATRLARAGSYSRPALEAARSQFATAQEAQKSAEAAQDNARSSVESATAELARRRQVAEAGGYNSRPVQEARRSLVSAQSARNAAQSEVTTVKANLSRLTTLLSEGLVAKRDVEVTQTALDAAQSRLESASEDVKASQAELDRQQKLAATDVTGNAEIQSAQSQLASAQADVRTRTAEVSRASEGVRLAKSALERESKVADADIANRREISTARATLENARTGLIRARQTLTVADSALARENRIYRLNLNNTAQVQAARSNVVSAQSEFDAASTALDLLKSSPSGTASLEIRSPIAGVIQDRNIARGETVDSDAALFTVVNLDTVALEAALYERDVVNVRTGAPIRVVADALPNRPFQGRISFIGTKLDPETRTLPARALIPNSGQLRIGMFARGTLTTGIGSPTVAVPRDAVQSVEEKPVVFVAGPEKYTYIQREVTTGNSANGLISILSGLKAGEKVVSSGAFVVKSQALKGELAEEGHH